MSSKRVRFAYANPSLDNLALHISGFDFRSIRIRNRIGLKIIRLEFNPSEILSKRVFHCSFRILTETPDHEMKAIRCNCGVHFIPPVLLEPRDACLLSCVAGRSYGPWARLSA